MTSKRLYFLSCQLLLLLAHQQTAITRHLLLGLHRQLVPQLLLRNVLSVHVLISNKNLQFFMVWLYLPLALYWQLELLRFFSLLEIHLTNFTLF